MCHNLRDTHVCGRQSTWHEDRN